tara:strand:+ start:695 stop:916 length:222 start_codon:yes stop_codon:yes gene_type:complete
LQKSKKNQKEKEEVKKKLIFHLPELNYYITMVFATTAFISGTAFAGLSTTGIGIVIGVCVFLSITITAAIIYN